MRKYLRKIARAKMRLEGIQRMNKRPWFINTNTGMLERGNSYFSEHWREYI